MQYLRQSRLAIAKHSRALSGIRSDDENSLQLTVGYRWTAPAVKKSTRGEWRLTRGFAE
jgi:hypothetical protein